jgi:hypothetical protein
MVTNKTASPAAIYSGQRREPDWQGPGPRCTTGGVPPINISSSLQPGTVSKRQIGLVDTGGYLAGSTLYLVTNCTSAE